MILVDSSGWLHYFMNGPLIERYEEMLGSPSGIYTPTIVLYEVYKKLKAEAGDEQIPLLCMEYMQKTNLVQLTPEIALNAADISLEYKMPMADSIIYATSLFYQAKLVTSDSDFEKLPGVTFINPKEE